MITINDTLRTNADTAMLKAICPDTDSICFRILHLIGVGQGGGKGVAYIAVDLIAEIGQHQKGDDRREQLAYKG